MLKFYTGYSANSYLNTYLATLSVIENNSKLLMDLSIKKITNMGDKIVIIFFNLRGPVQRIYNKDCF